MIIVLLLIIVPLVEIGVFIEVGGLLGLWPTLGIVVLTAILGGMILRHQGIATIWRIQTALARGEMPVQAMFDGACLLVAGATLLTPGFVTDTAGFLLFLPPVRAWLARVLIAYAKRRAANHHGGGRGPGADPRRPGRDDIIDVEYREVDDDHPRH